MITAKDCAQFLGYDLIGNNIEIVKVAALSEMTPGTLKFAAKYSEDIVNLINSSGGCFVIAHIDYAGKIKVTHVLSKNPRLDFCILANKFFPNTRLVGIEKTAIVASDATVGENVYIGHNTIIESGVKIGANTIILHNVVISKNCQIGSNCIIKSGTVIGQKGFGFERDACGVPIPFPHYGAVVIGDYVEIGALCTVVAGALENTIIEDFVKIDDHVHIAHNVRIGRGTMITACSEVSGSVYVGDQCWLGPNSSIIDKAKIGSKAFIGIGSVVTKDVPESAVVAGNPAKILRIKKDEQS